MIWVELVTILALVQFAVFGFLVGAARMKHGVLQLIAVGTPPGEDGTTISRAFTGKTLRAVANDTPSMALAPSLSDGRTACSTHCQRPGFACSVMTVAILACRRIWTRPEYPIWQP